jgi:peroxiredoxin
MISRRYFFMGGAAAVALGAVVVMNYSEAEAAAVVGQPAPDLMVADTQGGTRSLAEFRGKPVVLEWTSASCPFAAAHYRSGNMPALQKWAAENNVVWLSVLSTHPSRSDYLAPEKAAVFNRQRNAQPAALLMDSQGVLGRTYGARTTPHMFVIGPDGKLQYSGAIDEKPIFFAQDKIAQSKNYVRAALEDLAAGRPVAISATRPYGCSIGYA